jgi:CBS domain-containing protein
VRRIGSIVDRDVATCDMDTPADDLRGRLDGSDVAVVLDNGVVLGVVRSEDLDGRSGEQASELMREAPSTLRANLTVDELDERLRKTGVEDAVVTTPQGRFIGLVRLGTATS